jgi:Immunity protein family (Imm11)
MPVVSGRVALCLERVAPDDVQLVPLEVDGTSVEYFIANVLSVLDVIDDERSTGMRWVEGDGRPEKVGEWRMLERLVLDRDAVGDCQIFRPCGWEIAVIGSERLRRELVALPTTGLTFEEVSLS